MMRANKMNPAYWHPVWNTTLTVNASVFDLVGGFGFSKYEAFNSVSFKEIASTNVRGGVIRFDTKIVENFTSAHQSAMIFFSKTPGRSMNYFKRDLSTSPSLWEDSHYSTGCPAASAYGFNQMDVFGCKYAYIIWRLL